MTRPTTAPKMRRRSGARLQSCHTRCQCLGRAGRLFDPRLERFGAVREAPELLTLGGLQLRDVVEFGCLRFEDRGRLMSGSHHLGHEVFQGDGASASWPAVSSSPWWWGVVPRRVGQGRKRGVRRPMLAARPGFVLVGGVDAVVCRCAWVGRRRCRRHSWCRPQVVTVVVARNGWCAASHPLRRVIRRLSIVHEVIVQRVHFGRFVVVVVAARPPGL